MVSFNIMCSNDINQHTVNWYFNYISNKIMNFSPDKVQQGKFKINDDYYPTWDQIIPWFDSIARNPNTNKRSQDTRKIFVGLKFERKNLFFPLMSYVKKQLENFNLKMDSVHVYAGLGINSRASPPHIDGMTVFVVQVMGECNWRVFEDGCDYDDIKKTMTTRSTISKRLKRGEWLYIPKGIHHAAYPDSSRLLLSFGIKEKK